MSGITLGQALAILIPVLAIQLGLVAAALVNLGKRTDDEIRGSRAVWRVVLILSIFSFPAGILGSVAYFTLGKKSA